MNIEHFRTNSINLQAARIAHTATNNDFTDKIADAARVAADVEKRFGDDHERIAPYRAAVRTLKQQRAALKSPATYDPLPEIERWLERHPNAEPLAEPLIADVKKGETPLAAFNRRHELTNRILQRIRGFETAPADPDEAAVPLLAQIDALADKGAPRVINGRLMFATTLAGTTTIPDAIGLVAWLDRARLKSAVVAMLALDNSGPPMTALERSDALGKAFVELADALRQEAAVATEAERAGQRIERRRSVHPAVLIGRMAAPGEIFRYLTKGL